MWVRCGSYVFFTPVRATIYVVEQCVPFMQSRFVQILLLREQMCCCTLGTTETPVHLVHSPPAFCLGICTGGVAKLQVHQKAGRLSYRSQSPLARADERALSFAARVCPSACSPTCVSTSKLENARTVVWLSLDTELGASFCPGSGVASPAWHFRCNTTFAMYPFGCSRYF